MADQFLTRQQDHISNLTAAKYYIVLQKKNTSPVAMSFLSKDTSVSFIKPSCHLGWKCSEVLYRMATAVAFIVCSHTLILPVIQWSAYITGQATLATLALLQKRLAFGQRSESWLPQRVSKGKQLALTGSWQRPL